MKIIEVSHLKKGYDQVRAVNDVSFYVNEGELFAFLGSNGAGKSTTIHILCTLLKPDDGHVIIKNYQLNKDDIKIKQAIGIVFQLLKSGVRIAEDIEVIGFDDIELSRVIDPPLSTISKPHYDMAWHVADQLFKVIQGDPVPLPHATIEPQLVLRATTKKRRET